MQIRVCTVHTKEFHKVEAISDTLKHIYLYNNIDNIRRKLLGVRVGLGLDRFPILP